MSGSSGGGVGGGGFLLDPGSVCCKPDDVRVRKKSANSMTYKINNEPDGHTHFAYIDRVAQDFFFLFTVTY